jgi:hypothetical protein
MSQHITWLIRAQCVDFLPILYRGRGTVPVGLVLPSSCLAVAASERRRIGFLISGFGFFNPFLTPHSEFRNQMPRCINSSAPVSDTGCPGAIPGEAAILIFDSRF